MKNWSSADSFILYFNGGEFTSNAGKIRGKGAVFLMSVYCSLRTLCDLQF